ncbi:HlyD family secretion protein [Flexibacterium corallicola]|uniref:HlyD family secretion protein n=1 Tax=Flexibacterium corallicola TaxID=3037259 RepID=UPI00286EF6AC|nr:biotin/lipoyl-binding protein [Pseudovibrio sp. M1P-2-3]
MLELLACSLFTVLPDYLIRRFWQGRRLGREITVFTVWYELRWGITACMLLTIALITLVFFYHPSTSNVTSYFRTITILPETSGRVDKVYVENHDEVKAGELLFSLDATEEAAKVNSAKRKIDEIDAQLKLAQARLKNAEAVIVQAQSSLDQSNNELERTLELQSRNSNVVTEREIDTRRNQASSRQGQLDAALADKEAILTEIEATLPAEKASAQAALGEAEAEYAKKFIYAGVDGTISQFVLHPGDIVSPILRAAGILIPKGSGKSRFQAGFQQITAPVLKVGMISEITCASKPFVIIPMVITDIQEVIASGQFRPTDQLVDTQDIQKAGTFLAVLEPLYQGQTLDIPPGSKCVANAYTNNHELLASGTVGFWGTLYYHMVDTVGLLHAFILRLQALLFPVKILVFSGH